MRAGPLSSPRVIDLLNRHFVPVYVSNEDYEAGGPTSKRERAEYRRIYLETLNAKLSAGTVHVYLLAPDGRVVDSLHVATAAREEELVAALERTIRRLAVSPGEPVVPPQPQSALLVRNAPDGFIVHVAARYERQGGSWNEFPAENWITLDRNQWTGLLPPAEVVPGTQWAVPPTVAASLLTYCYPQTENNDATTHRIIEQALAGTVTLVQDGAARARLEGRVVLKHPFYPNRDDKNLVHATLVGYVDFDLNPRRISALRLATSRATYGTSPFAAAFRSVP